MYGKNGYMAMISEFLCMTCFIKTAEEGMVFWNSNNQVYIMIGGKIADRFEKVVGVYEIKVGIVS